MNSKAVWLTIGPAYRLHFLTYSRRTEYYRIIRLRIFSPSATVSATNQASHIFSFHIIHVNNNGLSHQRHLNNSIWSESTQWWSHELSKLWPQVNGSLHVRGWTKYCRSSWSCEARRDWPWPSSHLWEYQASRITICLTRCTGSPSVHTSSPRRKHMQL